MRESVRTTLLRYRKPLALGLSLGLHLIFVLFLLLQPTSGAFLDRDARALGDHTQTGIEVQFVEPVTSPKVSRPSPAKQAMTSFTQMTTPPTVDGLMPLKAPNPTKSLNDLFAKDTPAQSPQQALTTKQSDHDSHVKIDDRVAKTPNDLWAAIAPCWRRLAKPDTQAVRLSVSFSPVGTLSKPPVIERANGTRLTDASLKSESLAIDALAQCGPYLMAFGQSNVGVNFPAAGGNGKLQ